jgi:hypothetical protein
VALNLPYERPAEFIDLLRRHGPTMRYKENYDRVFAAKKKRFVRSGTLLGCEVIIDNDRTDGRFDFVSKEVAERMLRDGCD